MKYTDNEVIALMHQDTASALKKIADHIEKWKIGYQGTADFLREIADQKDAQAVVCRLRDELTKPKTP